MRWVSSKESVAKGEVTVLAIVETLCAIALVFYLSLHFNTLRWLAIAMCVSPLLLLRTDKSTRLGIKWFNVWTDKGIDFISKIKRPTSALSILPFVVLVAATAFAARVSAAVVAAIRSPIGSMSAIPRNWFRITATIDVRGSPELVPDHPHDAFAAAISDIKKPTLGRRAWAFMLLPVFLPTFLYRWSLKATSIIYAPLVFVAHSTFSEGKDLRTKLELIKRGDLSRIRVIFGGFVMVAFFVKLVLIGKWNGFAEWWYGNPITEFIAIYVAPWEIPKWQLAALANSALAIGSMLFAREALLRYDVGHPFPETPVKRILGFVSGLRWVLALYTIACTAYITMCEARDWHLPALGEKWIPWQ